MAHAQQTFLLSLFLRNLDIISQDHLGFCKVAFSFFHKIMWFFDNVCNSIFTFLDRVVKHGSICVAEISFSLKTLKIWSKMPYVIFMWSSSNSTWGFLVLKAETVFLF